MLNIVSDELFNVKPRRRRYLSVKHGVRRVFVLLNTLETALRVDFRMGWHRANAPALCL